MKHWYSHAIVGLIVAIAFIMVMRDLSQTALTTSVIAMLIGSILPDLDHPSGKLRGMLRYLVFVAIVLLLYFFLTQSGYIAVFAPGTLVSIIALAMILFLSYAITIGLERFIPGHRGPVHRLTAALIYSLLCGISAYSFGIPSAATIAAAGGAGYLTHLVSDML